MHISKKACHVYAFITEAKTKGKMCGHFSVVSCLHWIFNLLLWSKTLAQEQRNRGWRTLL